MCAEQSVARVFSGEGVPRGQKGSGEKQTTVPPAGRSRWVGGSGNFLQQLTDPRRPEWEPPV